MTKLEKLLEIEGYDTLEELLEAVLSDVVSPAICMNEGCFTCETEPDRVATACDPMLEADLGATR